jgi:hypothetical protein
MIPRNVVTSGLIRSIGWRQMPYDNDPDKLGVLDVSLRDGNIYRYYDVPEAVYQAFFHAPSVGAAFTQLIRNVFPCAHIRVARKKG